MSVFGFNDVHIEGNGTSYAAPHVTGAVALLQQYAQQQIDASNERFLGGARRHEVMKAVLLNSADKIDGVQGSGRTILDSLLKNWAQSEAYIDPATPLDDEMGAGHLNVRRAVQQFAPGEQESDGVVPLIGWDYSTLGGVGSDLTYSLNQPLEAGQYITITLAWDRIIQSTGGTTYNEGDQLFNPGVANLDLQLITADGMTVAAESRSEEMNLEHIFFVVQDAGEYDIRVTHAAGDIGTPGEFTNYALAWWYGGGSAPIPGDYCTGSA